MEMGIKCFHLNYLVGQSILTLSSLSTSSADGTNTIKEWKRKTILTLHEEGRGKNIDKARHLILNHANYEPQIQQDILNHCGVAKPVYKSCHTYLMIQIMNYMILITMSKEQLMCC